MKMSTIMQLPSSENFTFTYIQSSLSHSVSDACLQKIMIHQFIAAVQLIAACMY